MPANGASFPPRGPSFSQTTGPPDTQTLLLKEEMLRGNAKSQRQGHAAEAQRGDVENTGAGDFADR